MKNPNDILVSVIIPTYSRNTMLDRAIGGILRQTHSNLDIIVVDDNPSDSEFRKSTEELMKKYESEPRINYIKNKQNLGGAGARNEGIKVAKGEFIAFLDDDDEYYPDKIEKQLAVFLNSKSDKLALVYCYVEHVNQDGKTDCVVKNKFKGNCLYESMCDDCIAPTSLWLVRKTALLDVEGFTIVPCKQDSRVLLKLLEKGYEIDYVPEVLCKYYNFVGGNRISFSGKAIQGENIYREACRKNYDKLTERQRKHVEYAFATRLYRQLSYCIGTEKEMKKELDYMFKLRPLASFSFLAKKELRKIKRKILQK